MREMTKEEVDAFFRNLAELSSRGTEEQVRAYINEHYSRLPEKLQNEMLGHALLSAVQGQVREEKAMQQMLEEGLAAAETLEGVKAEIDRKDLTE